MLFRSPPPGFVLLGSFKQEYKTPGNTKSRDGKSRDDDRGPANGITIKIYIKR